MKRGRYADEYEKVRQRNNRVDGYGTGKGWRPAPRPEFPEPPTEADTERVARALDDYHAQVAKMNEAEQREEAARKMRAAEVSLKANRLLKQREYAAAGVKPPYLGEDGSPAFSLSFMKLLGWTVQEVDGERVLVKPAPPAKPKLATEEPKMDIPF